VRKGQYEYPFSIDLPNGLPSSLNKINNPKVPLPRASLLPQSRSAPMTKCDLPDKSQLIAPVPVRKDYHTTTLPHYLIYH